MHASTNLRDNLRDIPRDAGRDGDFACITFEAIDTLVEDLNRATECLKGPVYELDTKNFLFQKFKQSLSKDAQKEGP